MDKRSVSGLLGGLALFAFCAAMSFLVTAIIGFRIDPDVQADTSLIAAIIFIILFFVLTFFYLRSCKKITEGSS